MGPVNASGKRACVFFFLFPPPERREASPFPSFSPPPGPTAAPPPSRSEAAPPPRRSRPRGPLRSSSPARREAVAAAVTCPDSRQARPLLRRGDSQMVRQQELPPRPQCPAPRGLRRLLASPRGSDWESRVRSGRAGGEGEPATSALAPRRSPWTGWNKPRLQQGLRLHEALGFFLLSPLLTPHPAPVPPSPFASGGRVQVRSPEQSAMASNPERAEILLTELQVRPRPGRDAPAPWARKVWRRVAGRAKPLSAETRGCHSRAASFGSRTLSPRRSLACHRFELTLPTSGTRPCGLPAAESALPGAGSGQLPAPSRVSAARGRPCRPLPPSLRPPAGPAFPSSAAPYPPLNDSQAVFSSLPFPSDSAQRAPP